MKIGIIGLGLIGGSLGLELQTQPFVDKVFGFDIDMKNIIAVSANNIYNIQELVSKIVEVLPNAKKSSFAREAKDENVEDETYAKAEKGTWDAIKEKFGDVVDANLKALQFEGSDYFNIGTGIETDVNELFHRLNQILLTFYTIT